MFSRRWPASSYSPGSVRAAQAASARRWPLLALAGLLAGGAARAQTPVYSASIGSTTASSSLNQSSQFLPVAFTNAKTQLLFTDADLTAAGIPANAVIQGLQWYVVQDNTAGTTYFDLSADGNSSLTALPNNATFYTGALTTIASHVADTGVLNGWHTAAFSTPITRAGNKSLLLQLCRTGNSLTSDDKIAITGAGYYGMVTGYNHACSSTSGYYSNTIRPTLRFLYTVPVVSQLTVSTGTAASPTVIAAGTYGSITVTGTGYAQLGGAVAVNDQLVVEDGGGLLTACQPLTGAGSFTLRAGATLGICDAAGLAASGGAVQLTGARTFSPDANYIYNGSVAQVTGSSLPSQVRSLTTNATNLTLTAPVGISQLLNLAGAGNLIVNGQALTLTSTAAGTALVVNAGPGTVQGPATVQRYLDPALNPGLGYRQLSTPVANTTVADLATVGFAPVVNPAYNTSATPTSETPFPTVYGYDQSRLALANNLDIFDKGWVSPAALTDALTVGRGYTVNLPASEVVDFVGTLNNGDLAVPLSRNSDATAPAAGWQLLGNPYPAPLDLSLVAATDRVNLDAATYVSQSLGQYSTQYRAYVNGLSTNGANNSIVPSGQGFFVRVAAGQTTGSFTFRNSQRLTSFDATTSVQRPTADARPQVHLALRGTGAATDAAIVYFESGATAGLDAQYDAAKLPNSTGLNLSTAAATGQALAIDGRALPTGSLTVPLNVYVPATGTYTLHAEQLLNLTGLRVYLRDLQLGTLTDLAQQPSYSFSQNAAFLGARFELVINPKTTLATTAATSAQVAVYPNPARTVAYVELPAALGAQPVAAALLDALGREVRTATLAAQGARAHQLGLAGLPAGVYTLRLRTSAGVVAKRLVVE